MTPHAEGVNVLWFGREKEKERFAPWVKFTKGLNLKVHFLEDGEPDLDWANTVILTESSDSKERLLKCLEAGCFCVCAPTPEIEEFKKRVWVGDIRTGLRWIASFQHILNDLIDQTDSAVRLHLGAGPFYWPGFINMDYVGGQDIVGDIKELKTFKDDSVDEIHAIHVFEHIHRMDCETVAKEWWRVLKPRGLLALELPCLNKMAKLIVDGEPNIRLTLLGLYGDPREKNIYMEHKWGWSVEELGTVLSTCGFSDVAYEAPNFHIHARDMRMIGLKNGYN